MTQEAARLAALRDLGILDSPPEAEFDALVQAASLVCGTPISLISLVDEKRQWFKANIGLPGVNGTPREYAFCAHAIAGDDVMEVADATRDPRFADNPLVTGAPDIRFYAGAPIRLREGHAVGTLCVIDRQANQLDARQLDILRCLARAAGSAIDNWRARTALQESEARLRRTEAFLTRIGEVGGIGGFEFDLEAGIGTGSAEAYRIWGVDPAEKPMPSLFLALEYFAPEARPVIAAALQRAMAGKGGWDLELPFIPAHGRRIWVRTVGNVDIADGRPKRLTGAVQDVSDRVTERQMLQATLERLSLATESCDIGIWDWDIAAGVMHWDARMRALYGLQADEPVCRQEIWGELLHPEDREPALREVYAALDGTRPFNSEFRVVWPDGTVRHIAGTGRVTRDAQGAPVRMVGTNWDVTDRRAAESLRAARDAADSALRAKSEFLATMSHEIRSPLSGLIGVVDLLRTSGLNPEQARMANMVHRSAGTLLAVLNDILDFSKIEAGALTVSPHAVDLRTLIADTVQPWHVAAAHKRLELGVAIAPDVPPWLLLDGLRLRQILTNLIANAVKFTVAGGVRLDVAVCEDATLHCDVSDTGIGMSESVVAQLFSPFMQADGSTARRFGGTGLGLSISHQLARLMGGSLTASSRLGQGSLFRLALPLAPCAPATEPAEPNIAATLSLPAARVLVVDDDPTIRWLSQQQLLKIGMRADVAEDGAVALRMLQAEPYDLLLTDCHMPGLDGVALTRAVRAADQDRLRAMPIIGVTADVTEAQRDRCVAAGMSDLTIKPLTAEILAQLLQRHLGTRNEPAPGPAPQLRNVAFDDQIYLSIFAPGDPDGAAWLGEYVDSARADIAFLARKLAGKADAEEGRPDLAARAHRLAGASFSVGAMLLGQAARELECAAPTQPVSALRNRFDHVKRQFADAVSAMGREKEESLLF